VTVLFLSLLFLCSLSFRKALPPRFKRYMTGFLTVFMVGEAALVVHRQLILPQAHRVYFDARKQLGDSSVRPPTLTTEHGAKIRIGPVHVNAIVRDPNIVSLLMICTFFIPWFVLEGKSVKRGSRRRLPSKQ
jgi:hypothetical protein